MIMLTTLALIGVASLMTAPAQQTPPTPTWTVCIDPGHPSEVGKGTKGKLITEMDAAWKVAVGLKDILVKQGIKVVMTKEKVDEYVENKRRSEIANDSKADIFLRLHCDSASESGFASFYPSQAATKDGTTGPSPELLVTIKAMATTFHSTLAAELKDKLKDRGLRTDLQTAVGSKQGALTGSIYTKVPVILVEMAVLNQESDDAFMASEAGQTTMAKALAAATVAALKAKPKGSPQPYILRMARRGITAW